MGRPVDSGDPASPDVMLDLPPGSAAVHIPHREPLAMKGFERLMVVGRGSFDSDIDGQPASAQGKNGHAASFSLIACDAPGSAQGATSTAHGVDRRLDGHCRRDAPSLVVMNKTHRASRRETNQDPNVPQWFGTMVVVACLR